VTALKFALGLSGADPRVLYQQAVATGFAGDGSPEMLLPSKATEVGSGWVADRLPIPQPARGDGFSARWARGDMSNQGAVSWRSCQPVGLSRLGRLPDVALALQLLLRQDFRVCSSSGSDGTWSQDRSLRRQLVYGFDNGHYSHGWMCAFRGEGHDSLVSRRWLDHGPWALIRDEEHDISLILFHDPDERDPYIQAEQALPGHIRMGNHDEGGFIREGVDPETGAFRATGGYRFRNDLQGIYVAADRTFRIIVTGRDVSQREMLDAAAYRLHQRDDPDHPVDNVAFIFMEAERAHAHLHQLWLRELQCRTIVAGEEVRLDADYHAEPPTPPEWVQHWRARQRADDAG